MREFWRKAASPTGAADAAQVFRDIPQSSRAELIPEAQLNVLGYFHLQAGRTDAAITLFELNTIAYPASANTFDSLGDAYLAGGQNELALKMSEKALALLPKDPSTAERKQLIRESAEQKIASWREDFRTRQGIRWGLALKSEPGRLLGTVAIWRLIREHFRAEVGYDLSPACWGGIAARSCERWCATPRRMTERIARAWRWK